jgi:hypothetical protein
MRIISRLTPSNAGTALPSIEVPAAYGVTGTPRSSAAASTAATSAVDSGYATASGVTPVPAPSAPQSAAWEARAESPNVYRSSGSTSARNEQSCGIPRSTGRPC